ncbi:vegetative cell wall protein gp1-like [Panicum virgatum]|uniref:vegetative cell wall protein gp1-like n=1 Tax=Panicum virgatum TaxID=38727 RepID=UPI0019D5C906|nr:vegetative cell wall protein gp1-like [Panicum virgatum]
MPGRSPTASPWEAPHAFKVHDVDFGFGRPERVSSGGNNNPAHQGTNPLNPNPRPQPPQFPLPLPHRIGHSAPPRPAAAPPLRPPRGRATAPSRSPCHVAIARRLPPHHSAHRPPPLAARLRLRLRKQPSVQPCRPPSPRRRGPFSPASLSASPRQDLDSTAVCRPASRAPLATAVRQFLRLGVDLI